MRIHISGGVLEAEAAGEGGYPDQGLPGYGHPDQGLPSVPGVPGHLPSPPVGVWPPPTAAHPIVPAPPGTPPGVIWPSPGAPERPDQGLPGGPPPMPGHDLPSSVFWVVAGIPGVGWRYVAVDPSLMVDNAPTGPQPK